MKGITVPDTTEDFTADPVELFFDLVFVLAYSQLVGLLVHHPDWAGVGEAALLFVLMWLPWSQYTWSANAVSGNGRTVRLLFLVATAASVPMAASVSTAFDDGGPLFACSLAVIFVIALLTMRMAFPPGSPVRAATVRWGGTCLVAMAVVIAGSFLDGGARVVAWLVAVAVIVVALVLAGQGEWVVRTGHFAERHGLIIIIALGEVIVAIGAPVVERLETGAGLPATTAVALAATGVFAGALWWAYFDRVSPALEHRGEAVDGDRERGRFARDVYTISHLPIVAGIIVAAAGVEEIALHPDETLPVAFRAMLAGGLALAVLGVAAGVWRTFHVPAWERIAAGALIAAAAFGVGGAVDGVVLLVVVDLVIIGALVAEHVRIER